MLKAHGLVPDGHGCIASDSFTHNKRKNIIPNLFLLNNNLYSFIYLNRYFLQKIALKFLVPDALLKLSSSPRDTNKSATLALGSTSINM